MYNNIQYKIHFHNITLLVNLITDISCFNHPLDKLLSNFFHHNRKLGQQERFVIAETSYVFIKHYHQLQHIYQEYLNNNNKLYISSKEIFFILYIWYKICKINITITNASPAIINLINSIIQYKHKNDNLALTNSYNNIANLQLITEFPLWLIDLLKVQYSITEFIKLAQAMQQVAPLDLRVNTIKTNKKSCLAKLMQDNIKADITKFSPYCLRITDKTSLIKHKLLQDGFLEVQDEGSQLAALLLKPKRGDTVVDFCSGSGGKALMFGMLMHNTGRIYAFDINAARLDKLTPRLKRSGLSNIVPQVILHENDNKIKKLYNKIDRVFVDAPCTGLGTLRRNPDLKFRQNITSLVKLNSTQLSILNAASKLLKINGYLVYATCSILYQENQAIIQQFLLDNHDFKLINAIKFLDIDGLNSYNTIDNKTNSNIDNNCLILLPHIHQTDGFFAAVLQKISIEQQLC